MEYTKKQKVKRFLQYYDWIWSIPLGILAFILYPIAGSIIFRTEDFAFYDPSIFQAAIYTALIMVFQNMVVQMGIQFNHKGSANSYYDNASKNIFYKSSIWSRIKLYCFWYVFYSVEFIVIFLKLV